MSHLDLMSSFFPAVAAKISGPPPKQTYSSGRVPAQLLSPTRDPHHHSAKQSHTSSR